MGAKYLKPGQDFGPSHFSKDFGFHGSTRSSSAPRSAPAPMAKGGHAKKVTAHHPKRAMPKGKTTGGDAGGGEKMITMPRSVAEAAIKKATAAGMIAGAQGERAKQAGGGAGGPPMGAPPPDMGAGPAAPMAPPMAPGGPPMAAGMKRGGRVTR